MTKQDEYLIAAEIVDDLIAAMDRIPELNDSSAPEYARHAYGALDNALAFVRMWRDQIEQSLLAVGGSLSRSIAAMQAATSSRRALTATPDTED